MILPIWIAAEDAVSWVLVHLIGGYRADTATGKPERVLVQILPIALERN